MKVLPCPSEDPVYSQVKIAIVNWAPEFFNQSFLNVLVQINLFSTVSCLVYCEILIVVN